MIALKPKNWHDVIFDATSGTGGCHNDKLRDHQQRQSWNPDNSRACVNWGNPYRIGQRRLSGHSRSDIRKLTGTRRLTSDTERSRCRRYRTPPWPLWLNQGMNKQNSQIPHCTSPISHDAPVPYPTMHMCAHFCYKMVHCEIWDWCIVEFVNFVIPQGTRTTGTPAFWGYPHRLMITHTIESCWIPSQSKVEWPWRYRSRSKVITCDTPSHHAHASDHLYQIWKESIQNCRRYKADMIFNEGQGRRTLKI